MPFQKERLPLSDSIRILQLHPSTTPRSEIRCTLVETTLSKYDKNLVEHYIALSYVWGLTDDQSTIFVNDHPFKVMRNLSDALYALQEERSVVPLWIDAVCMNQEDTEEKSRQIQMMGRIYATATHTIVYFGESNTDIDSVFPLYGSCHKTADELETKFTLDLLQKVTKDLLARPWFSPNLGVSRTCFVTGSLDSVENHV